MDAHKIALEPAQEIALAKDYFASLPEGADYYIEMVARGEGRLFHVTADGAPVASTILRLDRDETGQVDLVVVALAGDGFGPDGIARLDRLLDKVAREHGAHVVRFHTHRAGLAKRARGLGYRQHYVMERAISVQ